MFDGDVSTDGYTPELLHDPRILGFIRKIAVTETSAFAVPRGNAPPTRITAVLNDGRRITREVANMPGFPGQPTQRADVERKFRSNVRKRWPEGRIEAILEALWSLEHTDDLASLLGRRSVREAQ